MKIPFSAGTLLLCLAGVFLLPNPGYAQLEKISGEAEKVYVQRRAELQEDSKSSWMRIHLNNVAQNPEGTGVVNAVRVAGDVQNCTTEADSPFVYYDVPAMSEIQRLPDVYPVDGSAMSPVRILMARNEYEPGSFVIYPLADLGKVEFRLKKFVNEKGDVFPLDNLDLKVVKVWYQNGNGWYSYFGDTELKLVPELLLNDEDLIEVDEVKKQNYARLIFPDGTVFREWLTAPLDMDRRNAQTGVFKPMAKSFRDAAKLQPVALKEGEFKQFFLTAHTDQNTPSGFYQGSVELVRNTNVIGSIPVEIRVLPFELPEPRSYFDLNKEYLTTLMSYCSLELIGLYNGGDYELAQKQYQKVMENNLKHNQKTP